MKKYIIVFASLLGIYSCNRDSISETTIEVNKKYSDNEIIATFSKIGELHNEGLSYIFNELKNEYGSTYSGGNSEQDHDKLIEKINQLSVYYVNKCMSVKNIDLQEILKTTTFNNHIKDYYGKNLVEEMETIKPTLKLTPEFIASMNSLNNIMNKAPSKAEYDKFMIDNIASITNIDEKIKFVACTSTAYHSLLYWSTELNNWQLFFNPQRKLYKLLSADASDSTGNKIGKADVAGIITGGISGCIYGGIGATAIMPVIGTISGCAAFGAIGALTGGLGNSARAVVDIFVDWLVG